MRRILISALACMGVSTGWAVEPKPATPPVAPAATPAAAPAPAWKSYSYLGDKYRDPFIPLTGAGADTDSDRAPQISTLQLKGIIQDPKGRVAVLSTGSMSYILRAGRLYDGRNRPLKGVSGVIKSQSVVLIGSDRTVKEIQLNKEDI